MANVVCEEVGTEDEDMARACPYNVRTSILDVFSWSLGGWLCLMSIGNTNLKLIPLSSFALGGGNFLGPPLWFLIALCSPYTILCLTDEGNHSTRISSALIQGHKTGHASCILSHSGLGPRLANGCFLWLFPGWQVSSAELMNHGREAGTSQAEPLKLQYPALSILASQAHWV